MALYIEPQSNAWLRRCCDGPARKTPTECRRDSNEGLLIHNVLDDNEVITCVPHAARC